MNPDPNNPINPAAAAAPSLTPPVAPAMPAAPTSTPQVAVPTPETTVPAPEAAPTTPEVPTIDPSLLQEAIADVPEEATATAPEVPSAVPLDNLTPAAEAVPTPEPAPFIGATPTADLTSPAADLTAAPTPEDVDQKATPSVAFNDPATQPDAARHELKKPGAIDLKKINPVVAIIVGSTLVIIALVLIIAFAI
ncbi:hypothetical protein IKE71_01640 [Candidatus Saccharibacteria bacterium]|nr:hypothetical protein [Candidatus Saccharibacteria bacterium]